MGTFELVEIEAFEDANDGYRQSHDAQHQSKGIDSFESLRDQAIEQGVEFIACKISMDVMSVKREELLDHVTIGGVATYMERADQANVNLFI